MSIHCWWAGTGTVPVRCLFHGPGPDWSWTCRLHPPDQDPGPCTTYNNMKNICIFEYRYIGMSPVFQIRIPHFADPESRSGSYLKSNKNQDNKTIKLNKNLLYVCLLNRK